jgi:hypothetical protein
MPTYIYNLRHTKFTVHPSLSLMSGSFLLLLVLFLAGCASSETTTPAPGEKPQGGGTITANPNPVPPGEGNGTTQISWNITDQSLGDVKVYVVEDGKPESLFAAGAKGSQDAPWIATGPTYEFRLYSGGTGSDRKLIDKVAVIRLR